MPLIVLSGFPSSGKTHRALQIQNFLKNVLQDKENYPALNFHSDPILINEETLKIDRKSVYSSSSFLY
jgi:tRNA uridine 5-carbamoylmethylation protein Kti12